MNFLFTRLLPFIFSIFSYQSILDYYTLLSHTLEIAAQHDGNRADAVQHDGDRADAVPHDGDRAGVVLATVDRADVATHAVDLLNKGL